MRKAGTKQVLPCVFEFDTSQPMEVTVNSKQYFDTTKGLGIMSTAEVTGKVDAAVYARPHIMEDGTLAYIMHDRLIHNNLNSNPHANYLFKEETICLIKISAKSFIESFNDL